MNWWLYAMHRTRERQTSFQCSDRWLALRHGYEHKRNRESNGTSERTLTGMSTSSKLGQKAEWLT
jgi:hypothetical protein